MTTLLANPWVSVIGVPLLLMWVGILAKRLGRRDGDKSPRRNDWAVGTTILLVFLGAVVRDLQPSNQSALWFVGAIAALFASIDHDRFKSWVLHPSDKLPTDTKRLLVGIVLPNLVSLVIFAIYQAYRMGIL